LSGTRVISTRPVRAGSLLAHLQWAEVDYIEEIGGGQIQAYELKLGSASARRGAESFKTAYQIEARVINQIITLISCWNAEAMLNLGFKEIFAGKIVNIWLTFTTGMDEFLRYTLG